MIKGYDPETTNVSGSMVLCKCGNEIRDLRELEPEEDAHQDCVECGGEVKYLDDEYGSLASGGSYEVFKCASCGTRCYHALPD